MSAALSIDFRHERRRPWSAIVLVLVGTLALALVGAWKLAQDKEMAATREAISHIDGAATPTKRRTGPADARNAQQLAGADVVLDDLTLPWDALFAALEHADAGGLALLGIAPDPATQSVRISGQSKNLQDALGYVKRLSDEALLTDVHLVSYNTVQHNNAPAIEFTVSAKWKKS